MDDTKKLSASDQKLLNRLNIPQNLKVLLENYWLENPVASKTWSAWNVFSMFFRPIMIAILASPYFVNGTTPFINMSLVVIWVICPMAIITYIITAFALYSLVEKQNDELMRRSFAVFLPGANSSFKKAYAIICWMLLAGLTASQGYFVTSIMIILCWMGTWLFSKIFEVALVKFLEERVIETSSERITRMAMNSLNK